MMLKGESHPLCTPNSVSWAGPTSLPLVVAVGPVLVWSASFFFYCFIFSVFSIFNFHLNFQTILDEFEYRRASKFIKDVV
jgi:hypothetical protein